MCREKPWPVCLRARIDERRLKREGMTLMSVTKKEAIGRLDAAGHRRAAAQLSGWRNKLGNDWGWGGLVSRRVSQPDRHIVRTT